MVDSEDLQRLMIEFADVLGGDLTGDVEKDFASIKKWFDDNNLEVKAVTDLVEAAYMAIMPMVMLGIARGEEKDVGILTRLAVYSALSTMFTVGWEAHKQYGKEGTSV